MAFVKVRGGETIAEVERLWKLKHRLVVNLAAKRLTAPK